MINIPGIKSFKVSLSKSPPKRMESSKSFQLKEIAQWKGNKCVVIPQSLVSWKYPQLTWGGGKSY